MCIGSSFHSCWPFLESAQSHTCSGSIFVNGSGNLLFDGYSIVSYSIQRASAESGRATMKVVWIAAL
jgi:hypothetical protein